MRVLFAAAHFLFATSREDISSERLPGGLGSSVMAQFDTGLIAGIRQAARQLKGASRRNWLLGLAEPMPDAVREPQKRSSVGIERRLLAA